jgi:hypothetical protein
MAATKQPAPEFVAAAQASGVQATLSIPLIIVSMRWTRLQSGRVC